LFVRFFVPSPHIESDLPVYTHAPAVLHSPTRSDALPSSPAIRLRPSNPVQRPAGALKGTRFAVLEDTAATGGGSQQEGEEETSASKHHNVKFQTRPRGNTTDSTNSAVYPTFAAYRQAQHGNFEAIAQRVKRAFAVSQQQRQQEEEARRQQLEQQQQQQQQQEQDQGQDMLLRPTNARTQSSSSVRILVSPPTAGSGGTRNGLNSNGTRSRSASAASMFSDIADRIKAGTLFSRSSVAIPAAESEDSKDKDALESVSDRTSSHDPTALDAGRADGVEILSGIEIRVTGTEDDHPQTGNVADTIHIKEGGA
ncbi:hypothetical protein BGZ99_000708, partial [Dissophora globulifera]